MNGEERLRAYIDRAFSGVPQTERIRDAKEELYSDLLEKYRALISQGQTPESAYQAVISGIGDIFELVDGIAGENGAPLPPQAQSYGEGTFSKWQGILPFAAAGLLLLLFFGQHFFEPGPHAGKTLPSLLLGAAIGAAILWWFLKIRQNPHSKPILSKGQLVITAIWCVAAILFVWAMLTPHLERILWLIPLAALCVHEIYFSWNAHKNSQQGGGHHE